MMRIGVVLLVLITAGLSACSKEETAAEIIEVRVERIASSREFKASWLLPSEARALVFARPSLFRAATWKTKEGQRIERRSSGEVFISDKPTKTFEVTISEQGSEIANDYTLMTQFSDGGTVLYTGHFDVTPIRCSEGCSEGEIAHVAGQASRSRIVAVPALRESVISGTIASRGPLAVEPSSAGAMIYFGTQSITKRNGYSVLADPALPEWIVDELDRELPLIFSLNARRFQQRLAALPVFFVPYKGGSEIYNLTHAGAVVENSVLLTLYGSSWQRRSDEVRENFLKLVSHEAFHLWNGSLFRSVNRPGGAWLHEGSADAFAYLTLVELGEISHERYIELQSRALNRCLLALSGASLPQVGDGVINAQYDCGAIIQLLVNQSLSKQRKNIWKLWGSLFSGASSNNGYYSHEQFFDLARSETQNSKLIDKLQSFANGDIFATQASPAAIESLFYSTFAMIGGKVEYDDREAQSWYKKLAGEKALLAIVEADCNGGGTFVPDGGAVRLIGGSRCSNLKTSQRVEALGGYDVTSEGLDAYDYAFSWCNIRAVIEVSSSSDGSSPFLQCPKLAKRARYATLSRL